MRSREVTKRSFILTSHLNFGTTHCNFELKYNFATSHRKFTTSLCDLVRYNGDSSRSYAFAFGAIYALFVAAERLHDISVHVTHDDPTVNTSGASELCAHVEGPFTLGETRRIFCTMDVRGRYVVISLPGDSETLTLCEVEVYGVLGKAIMRQQRARMVKFEYCTWEQRNALYFSTAVRACMRACMRVCVYACMRVCVFVCVLYVCLHVCL